MDPLVLVFGQPDGDRLELALEAVDDRRRFIHGPIELHSAGAVVVLPERNGIETMALANLAADLRDLIDHGGAASFGDHDFEGMLALQRDAAGTTSVTATLPDHDLFDVPLPTMSDADLEAQIDVVRAAAARFGSLDGWCCGVPPRTWSPPRA